jgi:HAD superfamily hydrolase (TIGR01490 family)
MREVALFDMDHTLVAANTWSLYSQFRKDRGEISWFARMRTSYWLAQYALGVIDAEKVAARECEQFGGLDANAFLASLEPWFAHYVRRHIRRDARESVAKHARKGDLVAIVTAANRFAAVHLAEELGIEHVVCTELEQQNGELTGRIAGPVCYGTAKVERARSFLDARGTRLERATFYSDSITDLPLLEQVGIPVAVCPDRRLSKVAQRRGWRVEAWR